MIKKENEYKGYLATLKALKSTSEKKQVGFKG